MWAESLDIYCLSCVVFIDVVCTDVCCFGGEKKRQAGEPVPVGAPARLDIGR